jgi:hypothetical protein
MLPPLSSRAIFSASMSSFLALPPWIELLLGRQLLLQDGAGLVEDADRQEPCVQIDAAVELVWFGVKSHHGLLGLGGA